MTAGPAGSLLDALVIGGGQAGQAGRADEEESNGAELSRAGECSPG
jgi:hypothetical protein